MGILNVRQQSDLIGRSLLKQKEGYESTTKVHAAASNAAKTAAENTRKYSTTRQTPRKGNSGRKQTEAEKRLDKLEKEYKAGQFERDIERYK
jgi:hypothetical protein